MQDRLMPIPDDRVAEFDYAYPHRLQACLMTSHPESKDHADIITICMGNLDALYYLSVPFGSDLSHVVLVDNQVFKALLALKLSQCEVRSVMQDALKTMINLLADMEKNLPIETAPALIYQLANNLSYGLYGMYGYMTYPLSFFYKNEIADIPAKATLLEPVQSLKI